MILFFFFFLVINKISQLCRIKIKFILFGAVFNSGLTLILYSHYLTTEMEFLRKRKGMVNSQLN